jgi:hypothetical protein
MKSAWITLGIMAVVFFVGTDTKEAIYLTGFTVIYLFPILIGAIDLS